MRTVIDEFISTEWLTSYGTFLDQVEIVPLTVNTAWDLVGGLSEPSKMPCYGYSIPAHYCNVGQVLRKVANSVCSICYAFRGRYGFTDVQDCLERRYAAFLYEPRWVEAMAFLINRLEKSGYFRWFDSGDVPSLEELEKIVEVVKLTPHIKHWLPTREYVEGANCMPPVIQAYLKKHGPFPPNLVVRLSAFMIDGPAPVAIARGLGLVTSGVSKERGFSCPASKQDNKCLDCRSCWDKRVKIVTYHKH